jgi:hypothetical protein
MSASRKNLKYIDMGWYEDAENNAVYRCFYLAPFSPTGKPGWFITFNDERKDTFHGPFKTLILARQYAERRNNEKSQKTKR